MPYTEERTEERTPILESSSKDSNSGCCHHDGGDLEGVCSSPKSPKPPGRDEEESTVHPPLPTKSAISFWTVISCLLIGVFIANTDTAIVFATYGRIGSDFNKLEDASWMILGYQLGLLSTQPLYGKLSDIFGRKALLLFAYAIFSVGCIAIGIATEFWHVIAGRVLSGVGGAGMTCVVSILLTDLVSIRELATWRSYVYIAATSGRGFGAPLGGFLVDTVGWRWSFLGQVPFAIGTFLLVAYKLQISITKSPEKQSIADQIRRIDFLGAASLAGAISSFLLFLDSTGKGRQWRNTFILVPGITTVVLVAVFCVVEAYFAKEPLFPIRLITNRDVAAIYSLLGLTTGAQVSLAASVALYFILTLGVSNANAASRMLFGNVAHAFGGLSGGILIKRTGRYRRIVLFGVGCGVVAFTLITLRWRGNTGIIESAYIGISGFGIGMINTSAFVALSASVSKEEQAVATAGFYLSDNLGFISITSMGNAILQLTLKHELVKRLSDYPERDKIIQEVLSSIESIKDLPRDLHTKAIQAYVVALQWDHGLSAVCCGIALFLGVVFLREYSLEGR